MTEKLTWAEFAEKYKPKDGDKFLDDRGNEWVLKDSSFHCFQCKGASVYWPGCLGKTLTCPLIPPKQKIKQWEALVQRDKGHFWRRSELLFTSEAQAKSFFPTCHRVIWPAVPNADGSYEVPE